MLSSESSFEAGLNLGISKTLVFFLSIFTSQCDCTFKKCKLVKNLWKMLTLRLKLFSFLNQQTESLVNSFVKKRPSNMGISW